MEEIEAEQREKFMFVNAAEYLPLKYFGTFCFSPDFRHFTYYGQKRLAEKLSPDIAKLINEETTR